MSTQDLVTELKNQGNALFAQKRYQDAFDKYGDALKHASDPAAITALRGNRAQACLSLHKYSDARLEAAEALIADPKNLKGWNRLARAYLGVTWVNEADAIFRLALRSPLTALEQGRIDVRAKGLHQIPNEFVKEVAQEYVTRATKLKEEGNALVTSSPPDFDAAYSKFTVAIALDPSSAIIRCNRAYCGNSLKLYDLAEADAKVAVALDPSFAKAWARLGTALAARRPPSTGLKDTTESKEAYSRALELLDAKPTLSPADTKLKQSVEQSIEGLIRQGSWVPVRGDPATKLPEMPWARAEKVLNNNYLHTMSIKESWYSSSYALAWAARYFKEGADKVFALRQHGQHVASQLGAVEPISNALTLDTRAFHMTRPDFIDLCGKQCNFEMTAVQGFLTAKTAEDTMRFAKEHLAKEGWSNGRNSGARIAIATTIRAGIIRAVIHERGLEDYKVALNLYSIIVKFIDMGRREWAGVPKQDRGSIFELTFLLGVEKMYLEGLCEALKARRFTNAPDTPGYLPRVKETAEKILAEAATLTDREVTSLRPPSQVLAFYYYPEAVAHNALGLYHACKYDIHHAKKDHTDLHLAAEHYRKAADLFPRDEEYRTGAIYQQLFALFRTGASLRVTLPLLDEIAQSMEETKPIWEYSTTTTGARQAFQRMVWFAEDARKGIDAGKLTLDSQILPDFLLQRNM
ncbi:TPR-like protein [Exidia glandulosa HHB12029]|uniref:TPR-like protein n=1 Tax=Exidia glandulosa HHB12029 TaxID=1314781 RepID=A0A165KDI8_EXIGL|nr:TPR-like protein [Exidia glandulosa HHB12029]